MIDLHAHVLPGLDDGPATVTEALALLRTMAGQGVRQVVAAAHAYDGVHNVSRDRLLRVCSGLRALLEQEGLRLELLPSMELYLSFEAVAAVKRGQVVGLAETSHLVVELPAAEVPLYAERALLELLQLGYQPILNHPERNRGIQREPDWVHRLAEQGVRFMITAGSLLGRFGARAQTAAEGFIRAGVADLVVSDAHNLAGRAPCLPAGLAAAARLGKLDQTAEWQLLRSTEGS